MNPQPKVIAHIDMDAFFAAVEQRDNPLWRGKPVVVGADPKGGRGRGVVSTCSYEARKFGIHSAMPISQAYQRCPHAVYISPDFRKYKQASTKIFQILERYTPDIEPISIDEAFLDLTTTHHLYESPVQMALKIKDDIRQEVNLTASIGLAPVKMVAKIASDFCKPDGLKVVLADQVQSFLDPLDVGRLWGVGQKSKEFLNKKGIYTIADLSRLTQQQVYSWLGESGLHWLNLSRGKDDRLVCVSEEAKSVSHEYTFDQDEGDPQKVSQVIFILCQKVSRRLRRESLQGKTITLKVRLKNFQTFTRSHTLAKRTNYVDEIHQTCRNLFEQFFKNGMKIRLIGVRLTGFEDPYVADDLFVDQLREKKEQVHQAVDKLKDRFGEGAIQWGHD